MERGEHDKEKGRKERMKKLGGTEESMSRERRELNQRRGREEGGVGGFGRTGASVSHSSYLYS